MKGLVCNLDGLGVNKENNKSKHLGNSYSLESVTAPIASHVLTHLILTNCVLGTVLSSLDFFFFFFFFSIHLALLGHVESSSLTRD